MTKPTIFPTKFTGADTDFLLAKVDREGCIRVDVKSVSIPSGTVVTTIVGLAPVNAGYRLDLGATKIFSAALGASVTASVGIVYNDNVTYTNAPTLFASGLTAVAAGGELVLTPSATNLPYVALADGWIVLTLAGATTASTGIVYAQLAGFYDGLDALN